MDSFGYLICNGWYNPTKRFPELGYTHTLEKCGEVAPYREGGYALREELLRQGWVEIFRNQHFCPLCSKEAGYDLKGA